MSTFTPPSIPQQIDDSFFGRFGGIPTGLSVVISSQSIPFGTGAYGTSAYGSGGRYITTPYPWLGDIANLVEGRDWFQGGRTYTVTDAVAAALVASGYVLNTSPTGTLVGFGSGLYSTGNYGS